MAVGLPMTHMGLCVCVCECAGYTVACICLGSSGTLGLMCGLGPCVYLSLGTPRCACPDLCFCVSVLEHVIDVNV